MKIVLRNIPSRALFYNCTEEELYNVYLEFTNGWLIDPVTCSSQQSIEKVVDTERYYEELLPYVDDIFIKRILVESMIIDAETSINYYKDAITNSTPEELERKLGDPDSSKWWTWNYPTRLEIYQSNIYSEEEDLRRYNNMLVELKRHEYCEIVETAN